MTGSSKQLGLFAPTETISVGDTVRIQLEGMDKPVVGQVEAVVRTDISPYSFHTEKDGYLGKLLDNKKTAPHFDGGWYSKKGMYYAVRYLANTWSWAFEDEILELVKKGEQNAN